MFDFIENYYEMKPTNLIAGFIWGFEQFKKLFTFNFTNSV
jgi:hypothetical protein